MPEVAWTQDNNERRRPKSSEVNFELPQPDAEEIPEEYLRKVTMRIGGLNVFQYSKARDEVMETLERLESNDDRKYSEYKQEKVLKLFSDSILPAAKPAPLPYEDKQEFFQHSDERPSKRIFFEPTDENHYTKDTYVTLLFGFPPSLTKYSQGITYMEKRINGKTIVVLGGGESMRDLFQSAHFKPKQVVNIDNYITKDAVGKNVRGNYKSIVLSATDNKLTKKIKTGEIPKADEILATYSVPYYLVTSEEIKNLFSNIVALLNDGGNARIYPICIQSTNEHQPESFEERKVALIAAVTEIAKKPDFNVTIINGSIKIHKIREKSA